MKYGKIIKGNLVIKAGDKNDYSEVERITGDLSIHSNAKLEASNLQSVGGGLYIDSNAKLEALQSVGGDLSIHSNAKLEASNLQSVGGYLYIDSNAKLEASNLQSVGGYLSIHSNAKLEAPNVKFNIEGTRKLALEFNFNCFLNMGFLFADRILAKILNKKTNKTNTVYKVQICGQTKVSYCVEYTNPDGSKTFAHGETIKQAKDSLIYKISNRDTSMYKDYTLDTVVTFEEAIKMYRVITGACEAGTRNFVEHLTKKKKKYTIQEIVTATEGQYGSDTFREFFECQK